MAQRLKMGQVVVIWNKQYAVSGIMSFREDSWQWQEYQLNPIGGGGKIWLEIQDVCENGRSYTKYATYVSCSLRVDRNAMQISYKGESYSLYERGTSYVSGYEGRGLDVDRNERCNYTEYIDQSGMKLVSIENWSGDVEVSEGSVLNPDDITITQEIKEQSGVSYQSDSTTGTTSSGKIMMTIIGAMIVCIIGFNIFAGLGLGSEQMSTYIKGSSHYTYVTSLTNDVNDKKAQVYESDLSIDETVKDIIKGVPKTIQNTVEASEDEEGDEAEAGIGLLSKKEYVYVYNTDDGKVYVQVSPIAYVTNETNAYHSAAHHHRYYRTYHRYRTNSSYSSYRNSIKQSSVGTHSSMGGGTSSGK